MCAIMYAPVMASSKRTGRGSSRRSSRSSRGSHGSAHAPEEPVRLDAREWFRVRVGTFANKHFDSADEARGFLDSLYNAGAKAVYVENSYQHRGRRYASTFRVVLPAGRSQALRVMERIAQGQPDGVHIEKAGVRVWWD